MCYESWFEAHRRAVIIWGCNDKAEINNLGLTENLIRLRRIRLDFPTSDGEIFLSDPAAEKEFAARLAKRHQFLVQELEKTEGGKCNAKYAGRSHN